MPHLMQYTVRTVAALSGCAIVCFVAATLLIAREGGVTRTALRERD